LAHGPSGALSKYIPNSIFGVDVSKACNIHDWMIHHSKNNKQLRKADDVFDENLQTLIEKYSKNIGIKLARKFIAKIYSHAARLYSKLAL